MAAEVTRLQALAPPWRSDVTAARPLAETAEVSVPYPAIMVEWTAEAEPVQHLLAAYEQRLTNVRQ